MRTGWGQCVNFANNTDETIKSEILEDITVYVRLILSRPLTRNLGNNYLFAPDGFPVDYYLVYLGVPGHEYYDLSSPAIFCSECLVGFQEYSKVTEVELGAHTDTYVQQEYRNSTSTPTASILDQDVKLGDYGYIVLGPGEFEDSVTGVMTFENGEIIQSILIGEELVDQVIECE